MAALNIIKAAYAFVALQGETTNKTIAMHTENQRKLQRNLSAKAAAAKRSFQVAAEPAVAASACVRRWWVYDSTEAPKQRVVLFPIGTAEPDSDTDTGAPIRPKDPKAPKAPRQLTTMATMAMTTPLPAARGRRS
jgi:hypothetical protein